MKKEFQMYLVPGMTIDFYLKKTGSSGRTKFTKKNNHRKILFVV